MTAARAQLVVPMRAVAGQLLGMMVLGGNVDGGKVHGEWPGLEEGQMVGPGDLAVTTDYRDVLSEVLVKRLNNTATN